MPEDGDGGIPVAPPPPPPPAPTWGSVPYPGGPPGWGGLPPGAVYGPPPGRRYRLRAVIIALVGGILLGLGVAVAVVATLATVFSEALAPGAVTGTHPVIPEGAGPVVGDCLLPSAVNVDLTNQGDVVDCRELHHSEVIGIAQLPDVSGRLDDTDVDYFADDACRIAFRDYVGGDYDDSVLFFDALVPSDQAYDDGDRAVYCLIDSDDHRDGRGSVRGSG